MASFKVIIVGGGPVGLVLAHVLTRAKIDYVLVERRDEIVFRTGAGLFAWPSTLRLLHQLGLLEKAEKITGNVSTFMDTYPDGTVIRASDFPTKLFENHGYHMVVFERSQLMELLYKELPDREQRIKTKKRVSRIETSEKGVTVHFEDRTSEHGSIIIGADGVHSKVRQQMSKLAPEGTVDEMPYTCQHTAVYGRSKLVDGVPAGHFINRHTYANGLAFQGFSSMDQMFFISYKNTAETKEAAHYSEEDAGEFLKDFMDDPVIGDVTVRDFWENRHTAGMTQIQSGMLKTWHWDRAVLVGDAAHKITPNQGSGANNGFESAASLGNHLHALLQSNPDPDTASLEKAFAAYQAERQPKSQFFVDGGAIDLGLLLWKSWLSRAMTLYITPLLEKSGFIEGKMGEAISTSVSLDFAPCEERTGKKPWRKLEKPVESPPAAFLGFQKRWWVGVAVVASVATFVRVYAS